MVELKLPQEWQEWHITEELGEGAYGRVYRAEKENGGVTAVSAIKVIQIPSERSELLSLRREFQTEEELHRNLKEMVDGYTNEIRAMYRLQGHTHIVSIQDHAVEEMKDGLGWRIYIRMEYLQPFDDYAMTHSFSREEIIRGLEDGMKAVGMEIPEYLRL
jgi:serine/threonine-protein kinase